MSLSGPIASAAAALAALLFAASPALAADGFSVSQESTGVAVDVFTDQAGVYFTYSPGGCGQSNVPCYGIVVLHGQAPVAVLSAGPCHPNEERSGVDCPAAQVSTLDFRFHQSGFWQGYNGGGKHGGACSPTGVTVETGPGKVVEVNAYDGCAETIICSTAKGTMVVVEADVSDVVRGPCMSIQRH